MRHRHGVTDGVEALVEHSDLRERIGQVPRSTMVRGLYFGCLKKGVEQAGELGRYQAYYPDDNSALRWYPISDFMEQLVVAAALVAGPRHVHEGMQLLGRQNAPTFAASLMGELILRILARDPIRLLNQGLTARRCSSNYGRWKITFPRSGRAVVSMHEEFLWIDSYLLGALEGTFQAIDCGVSVKVMLDSRFDGRHMIEW